MAESNGDYPVGCGSTFWQPKDGGWYYGIAPYLPEKQSWVSKGDRWGSALWPEWMTQVKEVVPMSFAANGYMRLGQGRWGMFGIMGVDQGPNTNFGGWMSRGRTREGEVKRPNDTVLFAERYGSYAGYGASNIFTGVSWWDTIFGNGGLIPDSELVFASDKPQKRTGRGYLVNGTLFSADNRNGGMNAAFSYRAKQAIAFADGYVAMMRPIETNPDSVAHPEKNKWDVEH